MKSDGDVVRVKTILHTEENFLLMNLKEQFLFGIFYGILLTAFIMYIFLFFALKDKIILFYSSYLFFIGLMQFTMDGFLHQLFSQDSNFFTDKAALLIALIAICLLGRYAESFLKIKSYSKNFYILFNIIYGTVVLMILPVLFVPSLLIYIYPLANILGLLTLFLITTSIIYLYYAKKQIDVFFSFGILFSILGFTMLILNDFDLVSDSFVVRHGPKFGTSLEVIFLSISMANLIKNLKQEKNHLNLLALKRSEELLEIKSNILSNISHELRTPLNAILNLTDYIPKDTQNNKVKQGIKTIKYSSLNLLNSINNILDYYKINNGELKLEETSFSLEKLLNQIHKNAKEQAKQKKLEFKYYKSDNTQTLCIGDVTRLKQVLNIVLSNALKYTLEGAIEFRVLVKFIENNKINLSMSIRDTGIGIPSEKMKDIFNSISENTSDKKLNFNGLGLGLFIAKEIVNFQKGDIRLDSKLGVGTTCIISLDLLIPANPEDQIIAVNQVFDLKVKNILVIEDNAINQMVIKMITKKWLNTTVSFTNNGQEGLAALKNNFFDIILMDLQMPIMDGYETTIAIRNGDAGQFNSTIPIIAVTADVMESTKQYVKEIGMNYYLSKPLNNDTLYNAINDLLIKHPSFN